MIKWKEKWTKKGVVLDEKVEKVRFWIAVRDDDLFSVAETSFADVF